MLDYEPLESKRGQRRARNRQHRRLGSSDGDVWAGAKRRKGGVSSSETKVDWLRARLEGDSIGRLGELQLQSDGRASSANGNRRSQTLEAKTDALEREVKRGRAASRGS